MKKIGIHLGIMLAVGLVMMADIFLLLSAFLYQSW